MNQNFQKQQGFVVKIIYYALCSSLFIYGYIIYAGFLDGGVQPEPQWPHPSFVHISNIPLFIATLMAAGSLVFNRWLVNEERIKNRFNNLVQKDLPPNINRMMPPRIKGLMQGL